MDIGKRLKDLRENRGLTLEQVGSYIGVNKATVQRYETGNIDIRRTTAIKLAEVLQSNPSYIMGWIDNDSPVDTRKSRVCIGRLEQENLDMTKEEIAKILKELRIKARLTQMQAATKINRKQQTLASWETGQSQPDANTLFVLCAMYGVSVDEAFGFKSKQTYEITAQYNFSPEAAEVAEAYDKADFKSKNSARYALDLPLLEPPAVEAAATIDKKQAV